MTVDVLYTASVAAAAAAAPPPHFTSRHLLTSLSRPLFSRWCSLSTLAANCSRGRSWCSCEPFCYPCGLFGRLHRSRRPFLGFGGVLGRLHRPSWPSSCFGRPFGRHYLPGRPFSCLCGLSGRPCPSGRSFLYLGGLFGRPRTLGCPFSNPSFVCRAHGPVATADYFTLVGSSSSSGQFGPLFPFPFVHGAPSRDIWGGSYYATSRFDSAPILLSSPYWRWRRGYAPLLARRPFFSA
jgi:hypothetical protein